MDNNSYNPLLAWIQSSARKTKASALQGLEQMRDQRGEYLWKLTPLPWQALENPQLLDALLTSGIPFSNLVAHPDFLKKSLREVACLLNVPIATHELLDKEGVPHMTEKECSVFTLTAIRSRLPNSLEEMHREHPELITSNVRANPSIIAIGVIHNWLSNRGKKSLRMVELVNEWGADWKLMYDQHNFITGTNIQSFEELKRDQEAARLAKSWDNTPTNEGVKRPRL